MTTEEVKERISQSFKEDQVRVFDMTGTSNHLQVFIVSEKFNGKSRIQRQRMVMDLFQPELTSGEVHALSIRALTPEEHGNN